jgi:glycosyltransferase involved in cell wall biosynthesis
MDMPDSTYPFPPAERAASAIGHTHAGETVLSNGITGEAKLTICVPCWKDSADAMIAMLVRMEDARSATLILYDDGSADDAVSRSLAHHIVRFPGPARLITSHKNMGRAHARNRLMALAETDWILFLDADMRPDDGRFIGRYLEAIKKTVGPALIAGGFSLTHVRPTAETALHAAQSSASEIVKADRRAREPGRYVFTSNILVHKQVMAAVGFDDGFTGWGWEDVDWGLNVAARFPVIHIDNPATHLGLDRTDAILNKFGGSGHNFARLAARHPSAVRAMPLYRMARRLRHLPARPLWRALARTGAKQHWLPMKLRLVGLKTYRALAYAEYFK